jgi:hypothetical protein
MNVGNDKNNKDGVGVVDKIFKGLCIAAITFAVIATIYACYDMFDGMLNAKYKGDEITTTTVYLKSVAYNSETTGNFALGFGSINNKEYYVCYEILSDGGIKLIKLEADKTTIYETLTDNEAYAEISTNGWGSTTETKLYVPKDTIQTDYDFSVNSAE